MGAALGMIRQENLANGEKPKNISYADRQKKMDAFIEEVRFYTNNYIREELSEIQLKKILKRELHRILYS